MQRFTFVEQCDSCQLLAEVFDPEGNSVAVFARTADSSVASDRAMKLALVLSGTIAAEKREIN